MLQITYTETDSKIAEQMQQDLSEANLRLKQRILIVLVSPASLSDDAVLGSINKALNEKQVLAPIILQDATLPENLRDLISLDLRGGYKKNKVIQFVNNLDIGQERIKRNRLGLWVVLAVIALVFIVSVATMTTGMIAPPLDEFATAKALEDAQIETVVAPQLEVLRPLTTKDAQGFPATVEAANEHIQPFLVGTATAIQLEQSASDTAQETVLETSTPAAETNGD